MSDTFFYIAAISIYGFVVILYIIQTFDLSKLEKRVRNLERIVKTRLEDEHDGHKK